MQTRGLIRKYRFRLMVAITLFSIGLPVAYSLGMLPPLTSWQLDIDPSSGRLRHSQYALGFLRYQSIENSSITFLLGPREAEQEVEWHPVVTGYPGSHFSPHYRFHGATHQIRTLEYAWERAKFTPEARRACALEMVKLWQRDDDDSASGRYAQSVFELALTRQGGKVERADLPPQ